MREAKNGKRGLPVYACVALAKLLEVPPMEIIAASELVTAKTEERRALFLPFVQTARNLHLSMIAGLASLIVLAEKVSDGVSCVKCLI
jgi:hypothetical protein